MGEGKLQIVQTSNTEDSVLRTKKSMLTDGFRPLDKDIMIQGPRETKQCWKVTFFFIRIVKVYKSYRYQTEKA